MFARHTHPTRALTILALCGAGAAPSPALAEDYSWMQDEQGLLSDQTQLTFPSMFVRAGEAYFDPTGEWIVFQAQRRPWGGEDLGPHYAMFVARLQRDGRTLLGIEDPIRLSPPGSANTCGWFIPNRPGAVLFASTITPPADASPTGYRRDSGEYKWDFPPEMELVRSFVPDVAADVLRARGVDEATIAPMLELEITEPPRLWNRWGYDAECAYSPDARFIVNVQADPDTGEADIWVYDENESTMTLLVSAKGYDGGPFFSPDGKRICYRSDRAGDGRLQVFIADLVFGDGGTITGVTRETPVTQNQHVNWAPFWHPSGEFLVYTTSELGHDNYEVYSVEAPVGPAADKTPDQLAKRRITHAKGFDGLPSFSPDGSYMLWTSHRGPANDEGKPNSQVWCASTAALDPRGPAPVKDE